MGTGVLSLPYACARLGWVLGIGSAIVFGFTAIYAGMLLSKCRNELFPEATSYGDLALVTGGKYFGKFTRAAILIGWACILPYYLVAAASALGSAIPQLGLCQWHWTVVLLLIMAPPLQLRTLHGIASLSLLSTASIVLVLLLLVPALLASQPRTFATQASLPPGQTFLQSSSSLGSFVFAYQGQSIFLEIMREMKNPSDFPKVVFAANGLMLFSYASICAVGYGAHGDQITSFLPDALPEGAVRSIVGLLLAYHTLVSYLLTGQPLHRAVHKMIWPHTCDEFSSREAAMHWAAVTLSFLVFAFFVANGIPFFSDFQDLLGNLFGAATLFGWPAFFYLKGRRLRGLPISTRDWICCGIFLFLLLPLFTLVGTLNSILQISRDWSKAGAHPFECKATV
jgi:amino acid permease